VFLGTENELFSILKSLCYGSIDLVYYPVGFWAGRYFWLCSVYGVFSVSGIALLVLL